MANSPIIDDTVFMAEAMQLAARGKYSTQPNPRVGCLIVKQDEIIGRGWHQIPGQGHAEVNALTDAGDAASGATAYVTLEPCSHTGKTGPCCEALVNAGIERVVVAMLDPNPLVSGQGVQYLKQHQVDVSIPLLEAQAEALNPGYIKRQKFQRPLVRCKLAMSLDGRTGLSNGDSKWITGAAARVDVQKLRAQSCAILTGIDTVLADDPEMKIRRSQLDVPEMDLAMHKQPLRVVLDSGLRIEADATILSPADEVIVICSDSGGWDGVKRDQLVAAGVEIVSLPAAGSRGVDLKEVMHFLAARECNEILVECGSRLAGAMLEIGLVDELIIYIGASLLGDKGLPLVKLPDFDSMDQISKLAFRDVRQIGEDIKITAVLK